jgi:hypothetical protein
VPWAWLASRLGKNDGAVHVVRRRALGLRTALLVAELLVGVFALYVVYELGRYDAGYDRQRVAQQRTELEVRIEKLEKSNREMRTQLAELDTFRVGRAREQAEVARTIGELQAQVAQKSQELAFYRGVVQQGAAVIGLKIEQLKITAVEGRPGLFSLHLSLVRSGRAEGDASGTLIVTLDGSADGAAKTLDLAALTGGRVREVRYTFRYFQDFDQELKVPLTFKPEQLSVEVHSVKRDVPPLSQTFLWTVETPP